MRKLLLVLACVGCSDSLQSTEPIGGALTVKGSVLDFETGAAVTGTPMLSTIGLTPEPMIVQSGASFTLSGVPEVSAFQLVAMMPPTYVPTVSPTIIAGKSDVSGARGYLVATNYLTALVNGFGVTTDSTRGVLLLHLLTPDGQPKPNIAGSNLVIAGTSGPQFLDATMHASTATVSSSSAWVVFFNVPAGTVTLGQAANATVTITMDTEPIGAAQVTVAEATVTDGAPAPLPTNVSFANDVFPIFTNRGCVGCHSGNGAGRDLGNLTLDGSTNLVYKELTGTEDPARVVLAMPEKSLVLTMPSAESPPDAHPNVTFRSPTDPDYEKILVWIREGAKDN